MVRYGAITKFLHSGPRPPSAAPGFSLVLPTTRVELWRRMIPRILCVGAATFDTILKVPAIPATPTRDEVEALLRR